MVTRFINKTDIKKIKIKPEVIIIYTKADKTIVADKKTYTDNGDYISYQYAEVRKWQ